jgi:hypothetical protein
MPIPYYLRKAGEILAALSGREVFGGVSSGAAPVKKIYSF